MRREPSFDVEAPEHDHTYTEKNIGQREGWNTLLRNMLVALKDFLFDKTSKVVVIFPHSLVV